MFFRISGHGGSPASSMAPCSCSLCNRWRVASTRHGRRRRSAAGPALILSSFVGSILCAVIGGVYQFWQLYRLLQGFAIRSCHRHHPPLPKLERWQQPVPDHAWCHEEFKEQKERYNSRRRSLERDSHTLAPLKRSLMRNTFKRALLWRSRCHRGRRRSCWGEERGGGWHDQTRIRAARRAEDPEILPNAHSHRSVHRYVACISPAGTLLSVNIPIPIPIPSARLSLDHTTSQRATDAVRTFRALSSAVCRLSR